jgi:hypothetical protein
MAKVGKSLINYKNYKERDFHLANKVAAMNF